MNAHASTDSGIHSTVDGSRNRIEEARGTRPTHLRKRKRGFTIVEMLTVVGVIAILLAITVPALRGVQTRTRKTVESNNIRQVYLAWTVYGNFNRDAAAPGYIEPDVQKAWRVRYEYPLAPDQSKPNDREIPPEIAAPWTWRIAPYFDHNIDVTWRYRNVPSRNWPGLVAMARDGALDHDNIANVEELMIAFAEEPAFGYNGYHVGGWWEMQPVPGGSGGGNGGTMPLPKFFSAKSVNGADPVEVVSRSISSIRRPADLIVFCTSTLYAKAGEYPRARDDHRHGSHLIMPPFLAKQPHWDSPPAGHPDHQNMVGTLAPDTHAPFGRYNGLPTLINADGSIESTLPVVLFDMRRWIDNPVRSDEPYEAWFAE